MSRSLLAILLSALLPLAGCVVDREHAGDPTLDYFESIQPLAVDEASLNGDLGNVLSFGVEPGVIDAYRDEDGHHYVTIEATTSTGAFVMGITDFAPHVLDQEPGTTYRYEAYPSVLGGRAFSEDFNVTGCSWSRGRAGVMDFDVPASQVEVTVIPSATSAEALTVQFVARFDSDYGPQWADGSFEVGLPSTEPEIVYGDRASAVSAVPR